MFELQKRILEISYKLQLSHLSSNLTSLPILEEIFKNKKENDICILSAGHAGLSLYVLYEKLYEFDAIKLYKKHGTHPTYCIKDKIYASSGSLGCALGLACGYAFSNRFRNVYVLISDGEYYEGIVKEIFSIKKRYKLDNLIIFLNLNGHTALGYIDVKELKKEIKVLCPDIQIREVGNSIPFFINSVDGHYQKLTKDEYQLNLDFYA